MGERTHPAQVDPNQFAAPFPDVAADEGRGRDPGRRPAAVKDLDFASLILLAARDAGIPIKPERG